MTPGTDLTAVALPVLPEGYRWVIDRNYVDSWTEKRHLGIHLEQRATRIFGWIKWKKLQSYRIKPSDKESFVECAERLARIMYRSQLAKLEKLLEEEAIIGVYENQALPD